MHKFGLPFFEEQCNSEARVRNRFFVMEVYAVSRPSIRICGQPSKVDLSTT
jgi:hypothetical protein